jgi:uncharacterized protein
MTHRRILENPMHVNDAVRRVRAWLDHPRVRILTPGHRHGEVLFDLLLHLGTAGNLTSDAHLAALAIEYQAELASTDADFCPVSAVALVQPTQTQVSCHWRFPGMLGGR